MLLQSILRKFKLENINIHDSKNEDTCSITIGSKDALLNIFIPLFNKYPLLTKKRYDYELWRDSLLIWNNNNITEEERITKIDLNKKNLNKYVDIHLFPTYESIVDHYNIYWFIGFIEAEGSFSIKTQKDGTHFIVGQREESEPCLQLILDNLLKLNPDKNCPVSIQTISNKLYKDKNKLRIIVTAVDYLYWCFIPYLLQYPFQARKGIDFILWLIAVQLKKKGFLKTEEGQLILQNIKDNHNSRRYFINKNPLLRDLLSIFKQDPLYSLSNTHEYNYRNNRKDSKSKL